MRHLLCTRKNTSTLRAKINKQHSHDFHKALTQNTRNSGAIIGIQT